VDGAGAVCTAAGVELLAATGQTGFSIPFPATSFPTFGGHTHVTSPYTFDYSYYLNGDLRSFSWRRQGAWLPFSTQRFTYDDAGRLATQSYALGSIGSQIGLMVDYAYDGAGRLTQQQVRVQVGAQQRTLTTSLQYADY
jgi:hypothetical protein